MSLLEYNSESLELIANAISSGDLIGLPTDTFYALCTDATNDLSVERIFRIKKREAGKALPVFVCSIEQASEFVEFDELSLELAKLYWPGKMTIVLPLKTKHTLSSLIYADDNSVALRIPNAPPLLSLIKQTGIPLTGTSINISNEPSLNCPQEIIEKFPDLKYVLNYPITVERQPSTIVKVINGRVKVIRQGAIEIPSCFIS